MGPVTLEHRYGSGAVKKLRAMEIYEKHKNRNQFACYCSTTMLTSKIIKEPIENLFQFGRDKPENSDDAVMKKTPLPLLSHF